MSTINTTCTGCSRMQLVETCHSTGKRNIIILLESDRSFNLAANCCDMRRHCYDCKHKINGSKNVEAISSSNTFASHRLFPGRLRIAVLSFPFDQILMSHPAVSGVPVLVSGKIDWEPLNLMVKESNPLVPLRISSVHIVNMILKYHLWILMG